MDTRTSGRVWYTDPITQDIDLLERAKTDIHGAFSEHLNFTPTYLLISTWDHVGYLKRTMIRYIVVPGVTLLLIVTSLLNVVEYLPMCNCYQWNHVIRYVSVQ